MMRYLKRANATHTHARTHKKLQIDLPDKHALALRFLRYHLMEVEPDDPAAWGIFQSCLRPALPDASAIVLSSLISHYSEAPSSDVRDRALGRANHLRSILTEEGPEQRTAQPTYVATVFDDLSINFENHLVNTLDYRVPGELRVLVKAEFTGGEDNMRVVDLGCGTGLMGKEFFDFVRHPESTLLTVTASTNREVRRA